MHIASIRPPIRSGYNDADVREENLITYFSGYLDKRIGVSVKHTIFDFHLDRTLTASDLLDCSADHFVVHIREMGSVPHYALRIANLLVSQSKNVVFYGQIGRLRDNPAVNRLGIKCISHDEELLIRMLFPENEEQPRLPFEDNTITPIPYFHELNLSEDRKKLMRASLETTRGCHFKCRFCFINHGENHNKRWVLRKNEAVVNDVAKYYELGIRSFNFMDSEFFGADHSEHVKKLQLLEKLKEKFPDISIMIYARADTLVRTGYLHKLRDLNVVNIYIGVESLSNEELRALKKGVTAETLLACIETLIDAGVSTCLSFITFNRATTTKTLSENLTNLETLFSHPNSQLLGMPSFIFSFESSWDGSGQWELSDRTYIRWAQYYKQPHSMDRVVYDTRLEPLMEIYRILHYEITKKSRDLIYHLDERHADVESWYQSVSQFSIHVMKFYLKRYELGQLTLESLIRNIGHLYKQIGYFYIRSLPEEFSNLTTQSETFNTMYASGAEVPYLDHGWDHAIPPIEAELRGG